ncbi:hypothetical protein EDWATA_02423 [Edwardsiella tarda ATCC 23685]|uniref:Uncharacterized protein n=1 Tax=Edwardsiella tarda ATCC 23685 TaxID=500638 RepID=D4F6N9_EDWTA|nr:hypothetical protein EDWATA_02423 [Edwardsiella tarda ATCC 23685]
MATTPTKDYAKIRKIALMAIKSILTMLQHNIRYIVIYFAADYAARQRTGHGSSNEQPRTR